ncbi:PQQ-dependent sugar dehydrogenase [Flavobacterium phragmitis]|uniref:Glucose/arabinose dehydrogenase, beta-propeller fold n=1 Tax=Flavobacterium phragmitis TaxID=739143 RepID=A0A1I1TAE6_9FLAO|nr:PQQ-dependent sugar dehydrogenase [Flavobacterium phragmitis]SFD55627.1 Glucose/arabinose dehydrogenase, beta-propeller fold [Flavobacterium phragmitis]
MIIQKSILLLAGVLVLGSCSSNDNDDNTNVGPTGPPVETGTANTSYQPAFSGQTRAGSIQTTTEYESKVITSGLSAPWGVAYLPDGRLLVTEKGGSMKIVTQAGVVGNALTGIPAVNPANQGGLLGICIDPAFETNRMIYWTFSEAVAGGNITAVAKGRLSNNETAVENVTVIYRSNTPNASTLHYGSRVVFDKTGNLFVSIGERSVLETRPLAQAVNSSLGKVVRITTNGQAATGNPTFTGTGALPELYTIGHRNPQGLAIHPTTGELWQSEHGPRGGDEINRIKAGANYGWPTITYGIEYGGEKIGEGITQKEGMEQPVYYWDPVVSPSGMTFYSGKRIPEWENNLFIGALSGMHIVRLAFKDNKVAGEERLLAGEGQRFRDITQGKDEALYAVTDQGRLYKIDKK